MKNTSVKKNLFYQMVYQILIIILPLVNSPYISRVLGVENLGIYSYTYSVANYFVLFIGLGIVNHGSRVIAENRNDRNELNNVFSNLFTLHFVIGIIVTFIYILYACIVVKEEQIYAIIQIIYVASGIFDINWFFFGIEKFKITVMRNMVTKLLTVVCVFIFVNKQGDLWIYCIIMAVSFLISQTVVWSFLRKYVTFVRPSWVKMKEHIIPLITLFLPVVAVSLYKIMDKIMLGSLSSRTQVGFYENSEKIINILLGLVTGVGIVMLPKMSNLIAVGDEKKSSYYINITMEVMIVVSMAMSFGLAAISDIFAPFFWGDEFDICGKLISILAITVPFIAFANVIRTQYLIPHRKERIYIISVSIGAIINIVINLLLIPKMGSIGAVVGTVCAEISVCFIQGVAVYRDLPIKMYLKKGILFLADGICMFLIIKHITPYLGKGIITLVIQILVGSVVYIGIGVIILIITKDELFMNSVMKFKLALNKSRQ